MDWRKVGHDRGMWLGDSERDGELVPVPVPVPVPEVSAYWHREREPNEPLGTRIYEGIERVRRRP